MLKSLLPDPVEQYIQSTFEDEPQSLKTLREETSLMTEAGLQVTPKLGRLISLLVRLIDARETLEIGVFTGYSSLCTLLALPEHGRHTALDISDDYTQIARRHWELAGFASKVDLIIGPAMKSLDDLVSAGRVFDFCFIDADKPNYCGYLERAIQLVRSNGLILVDNVLWHGQVADASDTSEQTVAIRQVNEMAATDTRVETVLLPLGDGVLAIRKV
jgi:predicted O-methyltransferase YrrM